MPRQPRSCLPAATYPQHPPFCTHLKDHKTSPKLLPVFRASLYSSDGPHPSMHPSGMPPRTTQVKCAILGHSSSSCCLHLATLSKNPATQLPPLQKKTHTKVHIMQERRVVSEFPLCVLRTQVAQPQLHVLIPAGRTMHSLFPNSSLFLLCLCLSISYIVRQDVS